MKSALPHSVWKTDATFYSTSDARDIFLTEDHPIKMQNRGFARAGELSPGDMLDTVDGSQTITSLFLRSYQDKVFNLCLMEPLALVANGFIIGDF